MPPIMRRTPIVRPMPIPIEAPFVIPEWTTEEDGVGEDVEDIMRVVGDKVGAMILELVEVEVVLLGRISILAISNRMPRLSSE
jgi:hypothetical protein